MRVTVCAGRCWRRHARALYTRLQLVSGREERRRGGWQAAGGHQLAGAALLPLPPLTRVSSSCICCPVSVSLSISSCTEQSVSRMPRLSWDEQTCVGGCWHRASWALGNRLGLQLSVPSQTTYPARHPPAHPQPLPSTAHLRQRMQLLLVLLQHRLGARVCAGEQGPDLLLNRRTRLAAQAAPIVLVVDGDLRGWGMEASKGGLRAGVISRACTEVERANILQEDSTSHGNKRKQPHVLLCHRPPAFAQATTLLTWPMRSLMP